MAIITNTQPTIVRTGRGLTIAGTRITIYQIMDHLKAGQPTEMIRDSFRLTIKQMEDVLAYIKTHSQEVEAEYQQVLTLAEENRHYWEEHNRKRFAQIENLPLNPENAELWSKLQTWKAQLSQEK